MAIQSPLQNLASYNFWANQLIIEWLKPENEELLNQKVSSSFPSLKATLLHIWNAERFWLSFLENKPTTPFVDEFNGTPEVFFKGILAQSVALEIFVMNLKASDFEIIYSINTPWLQGDNPCHIYILHVLNHSTYHRGQIITMGRFLGLQNPPNTDYSKYITNVKKSL